MCLVARSKHIAERDIIVYKTGIRNSKFFISSFFPFTYEKDKRPSHVDLVLKMELWTINDTSYGATYEPHVYEGYHAYIHKPSVSPASSYNKDSDRAYWGVGKFIIPEGTLFYSSGFNEIVSEQLIYKGICAEQ